MTDPSALLILSLDTTTRAGSAALTRGDRTLALVAGDATRTHGERLPGDIAALLDQARCGVSDVDLYAVAVGPGSFTGLRIGIAAVQGLALATGRKVVPVSALDALAACDAAVATGSGLTAPWIDAQRGQVFAALYRAADCIEAPIALPPEQVLARWAAAHPALATASFFVGDGATRYANVIRSALPTATIAQGPPLAAVIGRLAAARAAEAVAPHAIVPLYVRAPDAELARDRSRAATPGAS